MNKDTRTHFLHVPSRVLQELGGLGEIEATTQVHTGRRLPSVLDGATCAAHTILTHSAVLHHWDFFLRLSLPVEIRLQL